MSRIRTTLHAVMAVTALGCGTPGSSDITASETGDNRHQASENTSCDATARVVSPESSGVTDFYFRDDIVFTMSTGTDTASITLMDDHGSIIPGTTWIDDSVAEDAPLKVVFTPDASLAPDTGYSAQLDYCGGTPSVTFQTSNLGTPIERPDTLINHTYAIDLSAAQMSRPNLTAQALLTLVDDDLIMQVDAIRDDQIGVTIGALDPSTNEQNTCLPTINFDMPGNFTETPTFMVGPVDVPFSLASYKIVFYDAIATATFYADGSSFAGGTITGSLDARDIVEALAGKDVLPSEDPQDLCTIVEIGGLACSECRDGEPYCLSLDIQGVRGEGMTSNVEWVSQVDCHETCSESCDNDMCDSVDEFAVCDS